VSNPRLRDPLKRPPFRRLALSFAVNEMGDWLGIIALSVLVFEVTGSAMATAALFVGTGFLPALMTPFFVARLERPPPRFVLPAIYAAEAVAFCALAVLAENFSLAAIVAIAAVDGALALTAKTLTRAVTAAMLEPEGELRAGNAVLNIAFTGGAAVGPALAGAIIATLGIQSALLLDAASFFLIACIVLTARPLPQPESEPETPLWERVRGGLDYIRANPTLRRLVAAEAGLFIFFSLVIPIEVIYAKEDLGLDAVGYGLMVNSWGAGMVLGSIVFARLRRASLPVLLFVSTVAIGVAYFGLAAAQGLAVACAASFVGGAGNGVQWVAMVSAVQELTRPSMQARVLGTLESSVSATPGIGFVLGGLIASQWSPRAAFVVAGIGVIAILLVSALILGRNWPGGDAKERPGSFDAAEEEIMVELIPAEALSSPERRL
jgi:predicted MFS family arabinose efflux permease